ncbi:pathogenesis-related protein PR-1 [Ricinus communis]|nr:pathogenesis-related protein PR-1 [Ricinus communis]
MGADLFLLAPFFFFESDGVYHTLGCAVRTTSNIFGRSQAMPSRCCRVLALILVSSLMIVSASATLEHLASALARLNISVTISPFSPRPPVVLSKAKMARQFLAAHNIVRSVFGLPPLRWNRKLARYARRWANQRAGDCALQHSPNSPYGENLFWSLKGNWGPREVVKVWADEYIFYDPIRNECINGEMCGHYTQIIWRKTEELGCGRVQCGDDKGFLYVCSYNPPGNIYFRGPFGGHFTNSIVKPPS